MHASRGAHTLNRLHWPLVSVCQDVAGLRDFLLPIRESHVMPLLAKAIREIKPPVPITTTARPTAKDAKEEEMMQLVQTW